MKNEKREEPSQKVVSSSYKGIDGNMILGVRKKSNNQSTNTLDKSCASSSRQTPQSALAKKIVKPPTKEEVNKSAVFKSNKMTI